MKKVVQLALLTTIISTATTHCWEWSNLVPNRLQNWYQNWQIRKQELQQFKHLNRMYTGYTKEGRAPLRLETRIETLKREKRMDEQKADYATNDEMKLLYAREAQDAAKSIAILKKYADLPQVKLHNKYFSSEYF